MKPPEKKSVKAGLPATARISSGAIKAQPQNGLFQPPERSSFRRDPKCWAMPFIK